MTGARSAGTDGDATARVARGLKPAREDADRTMQPGGLVALGAADAVVCEGDVCWVPPAEG
ncbi:hypothetical protein [Ornithinimicrobium cavernae]|uniref:hypothetical protein n=1 Tax=Ornithinimicrobium cavernae TaxID=2666047 RepID=UPI0012B17C4A|nr:hypothetical protein [Ornithinimicrobium cavernae]